LWGVGRGKKPFEKREKQKKMIFVWEKCKGTEDRTRGRERRLMSALTSTAIFTPEGHEFTYRVKHSEQPKLLGYHYCTECSGFVALGVEVPC
jgi:hypothetical protein